MNRLKNAIEAGKFAWKRYLNGKTWNGIMLRTQPLFCCYGQIGYQVFVYDREQHAAHTIGRNSKPKFLLTKIRRNELCFLYWW